MRYLTRLSLKSIEQPFLILIDTLFSKEYNPIKTEVLLFNPSEKSVKKKLRLFKGNREPDIYDVREKRPIDINGELMGEDIPDSTYEEFDDDEWWRLRAIVIIQTEITDDPLEWRMAELMLDYGYTEEEVAKILKVSPKRIEWFMRKIEGWKRKGGEKQ